MPASVAARLAGVRADSSFFITSMVSAETRDRKCFSMQLIFVVDMITQI